MREIKDLSYWKNNAEEDYLNTPISVLKYITELENSQNEISKTVINVSQDEVLGVCIKSHSSCGEYFEEGTEGGIVLECYDRKFWKPKQ